MKLLLFYILIILLNINSVCGQHKYEFSAGAYQGLFPTSNQTGNTTYFEGENLDNTTIVNRRYNSVIKSTFSYNLKTGYEIRYNHNLFTKKKWTPFYGIQIRNQRIELNEKGILVSKGELISQDTFNLSPNNSSTSDSIVFLNQIDFPTTNNFSTTSLYIPLGIKYRISNKLQVYSSAAIGFTIKHKEQDIGIDYKQTGSHNGKRIFSIIYSSEYNNSLNFINPLFNLSLGAQLKILNSLYLDFNISKELSNLLYRYENNKLYRVGYGFNPPYSIPSKPIGLFLGLTYKI